MQQVKVNDPDIYQEFMNGNWIVNKNPNVPFCCLGADHGLEQVNRTMKVSGGLVGIAPNASARNRFFLVAPHLILLAEEAELMVGSNIDARKIHQESGVKFQQQREADVYLLTQMIQQFGNPFADDGITLVNLVTKKVLVHDAQHDLLSCGIIGEKLHKTFIMERIASNLNIWSPMKKTKLKTWKSGNKTMKFNSTYAKVIELTEDRALLGRMMINEK